MIQFLAGMIVGVVGVAAWANYSMRHRRCQRCHWSLRPHEEVFCKACKYEIDHVANLIEEQHGVRVHIDPKATGFFH